MTREEKIALLENLVARKRAIDSFYSGFHQLFGTGNGFPGAGDGDFNVYLDLFNDYVALVADKIGDTPDGLNWFIYDNDCGSDGKECCIVGGEMKAINSAADYIDFMEIDEDQ